MDFDWDGHLNATSLGQRFAQRHRRLLAATDPAGMPRIVFGPRRSHPLLVYGGVENRGYASPLPVATDRQNDTAAASWEAARKVARQAGFRTLTLRADVDHPNAESWRTLRLGTTPARNVLTIWRRQVADFDRIPLWVRAKNWVGGVSPAVIQPASLLLDAPPAPDLLDGNVLPDVEWTDDFDPLVSQVAQINGQTIGWLLVSRRRRGLLYNRFHVDPSASVAGIGLGLAVAAFDAHRKNRPESAAFAHVHAERKTVFRFALSYMAPCCDHVDRHWVATELLDR